MTRGTGTAGLTGAVTLAATLMLAACGSNMTEAERRAADGLTPRGTPANDVMENDTMGNEVAANAVDPAADAQAAEERLATRARSAMESTLNDPFSARFRRVSTGRNGALCGQVNAKNRMGAYTGFQTFITFSSSNAVYFQEQPGDRTDPYSTFGPAWQRGCASAAERRDYAASIADESDGMGDTPYVETPQDRADAALGRAERGELDSPSAVDKDYSDR